MPPISGGHPRVPKARSLGSPQHLTPAPPKTSLKIFIPLFLQGAGASPTSSVCLGPQQVPRSVLSLGCTHRAPAQKAPPRVPLHPQCRHSKVLIHALLISQPCLKPFTVSLPTAPKIMIKTLNKIPLGVLSKRVYSTALNCNELIMAPNCSELIVYECWFNFCSLLEFSCHCHILSTERNDMFTCKKTSE